MFKMSTKMNINFPKFNFQKDLNSVARLIIIPSLTEHMNNQETIDESPYPKLEPKTIARKTGQNVKRFFNKQGLQRNNKKNNKEIERFGLDKLLDPRTLFETGTLHSSFIQQNKGKTAVIVTINNKRLQIGKYLQVTGVGNKKKKFKFFGISNRMRDSSMEYMAKRIKEGLKDSVGK